MRSLLSLEVLLGNPSPDTRYQIALQQSSAGSSATLCLEPTTKTKRIQNIDMWTEAFHIFVGVYTQKYPHEAPALMKYGQTIRDLAGRGHNWLYYDENFRFSPSNPGWSASMGFCSRRIVATLAIPCTERISQPCTV